MAIHSAQLGKVLDRYREALASNDTMPRFLSGDVTGFYGFMVRKIRERVAELSPDLPAGKIVMNATHTHTTGDIAGMAKAGVDYPCDMERMPTEEYQEFFVSSAAAAIIEAWNTRKPGAVAWGYGFAATGHSRRTVYFDDVSKRAGSENTPGVRVDGHARMYGNTHDPMFSHFEAGRSSSTCSTVRRRAQANRRVVNVPVPRSVRARVRFGRVWRVGRTSPVRTAAFILRNAPPPATLARPAYAEARSAFQLKATTSARRAPTAAPPRSTRCWPGRRKTSAMRCP